MRSLDAGVAAIYTLHLLGEQVGERGRLRCDKAREARQTRAINLNSSPAQKRNFATAHGRQLEISSPTFSHLPAGAAALPDRVAGRASASLRVGGILGLMVLALAIRARHRAERVEWKLAGHNPVSQSDR